MGRPKDPNLIGSIFGCYEVVEREKERTTTGTKVLVRCLSCGNVLWRYLSGLRKHQPQSCPSCPRKVFAPKLKDKSPEAVLGFATVSPSEAKIWHAASHELLIPLLPQETITSIESGETKLYHGPLYGAMVPTTLYPAKTSTDPLRTPNLLVSSRLWDLYFSNQEVMESIWGADTEKQLNLLLGPKLVQELQDLLDGHSGYPYWTNSPGPEGKIWVYPTWYN